jgi:hypothetical protein
METWCEPLQMPHGGYVYGGAARNVRIANFGGMPAILTRVFQEASAFKSKPTRVSNVLELVKKAKRA